MDQLIIFIVIGVIIIAFVIIGSFYTRKAKIKRKLRNAESKKLSNFKDGELAKVIGNVEFVEEPLMSPLSNRECSYYYIHIEESVSSGKNSHWETRIKEEVYNNFLIKEGSSYAFINDDNIKCYLVEDRKYSSGFLNDPSEHLEHFLNNRGIKIDTFFGFNKTFRYKEGILENKEGIAIYGKGEWKDASELELPEEYGKILAISSTQDCSIYLSDDPETTIHKAAKVSRKRKKFDSKSRRRRNRNERH